MAAAKMRVFPTADGALQVQQSPCQWSSPGPADAECSVDAETRGRIVFVLPARHCQCPGPACTVHCPECGLGSWSSLARATRLAVCAVFRVLLVAVSIFSLSVAAKATPEPAGAGVAACSELSERRDRLHAEIARLHAETALVEAELVLLCTERSNQTDVGLRPLLALPSHSPGGTTHRATGMQRIAQQTARRAGPARRSGKDEITYAVHCWAPNSAFTDPSCNCLGEAAHPKLGSRPMIRIIVGSWYGPPAPLP